MPAISTLITRPLSVAYTSVFGAQRPLTTLPRPPTVAPRETKCATELTFVKAMIESDNTAQLEYRAMRVGNHPPPARTANITLKAVHATWFFCLSSNKK
jgi:hypothetical protein